MKIRTIIVDDEAPARRRIKRLLQNFPEIELLGEAENGEEAIGLIEKTKPDFLLLDIQLKDMTGFEVLKNAKQSENCKVIFVTAYDEYAIKAFEANAIDYLLKPFKEDRFFDAIKKVIKAIEIKNYPSFIELLEKLKSLNETDFSISIKEGKLIHYFNSEELLYIKSENYYCNFYSADSSNSKLLRISLKNLESSLPENFLRINKSVIINKDKIRAIKELKNSIEIFMIDGISFMAYKTFGDVVKGLAIGD